jgi:hypothetical protein
MSRKLTVTLIFFLFLLPFVSWYYLQSGLDYRKKVQAALSGTKEFPILPFRSLSGKLLEKSNLENHVSLVVIMNCDSLSSQMEVVVDLYKDFKETHKSNILFIDTCAGSALVLPDTLKQSIYTIQCSDSLQACAPILKEWPIGKTYALLDKNGIIRAYLSANTKDEKRILEEHMAILLPRDYSEKVQLKREAEQKK